jgi:metal-sulfur cluster biosynthetic enzyme
LGNQGVFGIVNVKWVCGSRIDLSRNEKCIHYFATSQISEAKMKPITEAIIRQALTQVIDPELGIDIVKLGLIYRIEIAEEAKEGKAQLPQPRVTIVMTLTTPGCPLAMVFDQMVRDALFGIPDLDADKDVAIQLTFDPPWVPDMMDAEARAELGFD